MSGRACVKGCGIAADFNTSYVWHFLFYELKIKIKTKKITGAGNNPSIYWHKKGFEKNKKSLKSACNYWIYGVNY